MYRNKKKWKPKLFTINEKKKIKQNIKKTKKNSNYKKSFFISDFAQECFEF